MNFNSVNTNEKVKTSCALHKVHSFKMLSVSVSELKFGESNNIICLNCMHSAQVACNALGVEQWLVGYYLVLAVVAYLWQLIRNTIEIV